MSIVETRTVASGREPVRRILRPRVYAGTIASVFVGLVITMALKDGASGAAVTVLIALAVAATAVGVWGTAMAVRETENLGTPTED
jgi:hypothetical protein